MTILWPVFWLAVGGLTSLILVRYRHSWWHEVPDAELDIIARLCQFAADGTCMGLRHCADLSRQADAELQRREGAKPS